MYVSAFEHDFCAVEKPLQCSSDHPAPSWPQNFKMGYLEDRKRYKKSRNERTVKEILANVFYYLIFSEVLGELFAYTRANYPYNVVKSDNITLYDELTDEYTSYSDEETSTLGIE